MATQIIFFRLLFAHLLADFPLQSDSLKENKWKDNCKGVWWIGLHSLIHAILAYIIVGDWTNWIIPFVIFVSHFAIDWFKVIFYGKSFKAFCIDQISHLAVITIVAIVYSQNWVWICSIYQQLFNRTSWVIIGIAYVVLLFPTSYFVNYFLSKWDVVSKEDTNSLSNVSNQKKNSNGLENAGRFIGYLERILILTFILVGKWDGIGFIIAAKSVLRFGDIKNHKERNVTEYVILGTLISCTVAILVGILTTIILRNI